MLLSGIAGKLKDDGFEKRQCSLHIAAWSIPFVLTTVLFVTNVIEADSLSGWHRLNEMLTVRYYGDTH